MRADQVVIAVLIPPGIALLYLLFAGEVSLSEMIAGAPAVVIGSVYALALARSETVALRMAARGLGSLARGCLGVLPECWKVGQGLLRAVRQRPEAMQGVITHVPFRFGGPARDDAGRRAAVVLSISLAPNSFAVGLDQARDELILHQLTPGPAGGDREWPL